MKPTSKPRGSIRLLMLRIGIAIGALVAHQVTRLEGNEFAAYGQSADKVAGPTRTQKLANPLNDLLDEAQRDIDSNNFEAAIAPLQKFLTEQPNVAFAHFQLAYAYTALKRADDAKGEYQRALELDPKMSEAALNLGILLLPSDPTGAAAALRKAVDLLPSQSRPRYLLGLALERTGDLPGAAGAFEGASRLESHDAEPLVHLGEINLKLNRPADAAAKFRAALEIEKSNFAALLGVAKSLDAQKSPEAEAAYRDYLAAQPADSAARARLVHLLLEKQQYDAAIAELDRADAGKAPMVDSLRLRADIEIGQKKWDDAIATLQKAITLAPGDAELHGGLGRVYLQKRDFPSAEKELKAAIQIDHNDIVYWKDLSSTYYLGGNFSAALAALDVVAKAETPGAGAWFIRALCYDKLNQFQPALDAYQKFLDLDKDQNPDQVWQAQQRSKVLRRKLEEKR